MPSYIDTSAVLRLVEGRGDLSLVEAAMANEPLSSVLADLECWTSIHKKWHDEEIDQPERDQLLAGAGSVLLAINLLALSDDVLAEARGLAQRSALRTLDGIHLATAACASGQLPWAPGGMRFCTADVRQAEAAQLRLGASQVDLVPPWR